MNNELNIPNSSSKNSARNSISSNQNININVIKGDNSGNNSAKNSSRQSTTQKSIDLTSDSLIRENSSHSQSNKINTNLNLDLPHLNKLNRDSKSSSEHFDNDEFYFPDHSRIEVNKNESLLSDYEITKN